MRRPSFAALVFFALSGSVPACTCVHVMPFSYAKHRLDYDRVFHGKVEESAIDSTAWLRKMRFRVLKDYSPASPVSDDTVTVWSQVGGEACGIGYPVGAQVLIFADFNRQRGGNHLLWTTSCSRNAVPPQLDTALAGMEAATGVRKRGTARPARGEGAGSGCGRVIFPGEVKANGARAATGGR